MAAEFLYFFKQNVVVGMNLQLFSILNSFSVLYWSRWWMPCIRQIYISISCIFFSREWCSYCHLLPILQASVVSYMELWNPFPGKSVMKFIDVSYISIFQL